MDNDAGGPDDEANVISETQITGAEDKGIKVDLGGFATIERSCVHDNANGGIQSTLGGNREGNRIFKPLFAPLRLYRGAFGRSIA